MPISRRTLLLNGAALPVLARTRPARAQADVLRFGLSAYPPNLTPWTQAGTAASTFKLLTMRGLLSYGPDGALRGELAESWERDGATGWIFRLRAARFHNGSPVTADDVKWTIEQVAAPRSTAYFRSAFQDAERIETPDARTVRIIMKEPNVTLPYWMAAPYMPIVARGSLDETGRGVSAGPYVLSAFERGVSLDLNAFDGYYKPGLPKPRRLRVTAYTDDNLRMAALRAGDVDIIEYVPWSEMQAIEADPRLKLDGTNGPFMYLTFNGRTGPFTNVLARRAVAFAIKREDIVTTAFFGRGAPLQGLPIPAGSEFHDAQLASAWRHDPVMARQLLAQAGVAPGTSCTLLSPSAFAFQRSICEIVQRDLAAIGLQVQFNLQPDLGNYINLGNRGQYDMALVGNVADNTDPDGLAALIDGGLPPSFVRSFNLAIPRLSELLVAGRRQFDGAARREIYREVQRLVVEQVPIAGLAYRLQAYAMRRDLQGFRTLPGQVSFYSGITVEDAYLA